MAVPVTKIIPPTAYVFMVSQNGETFAAAGSLDRAMSIARDEINTFAYGETLVWTEHLADRQMSWWYSVPHQSTPRMFEVQRWVVEW